MTLKVTDNQYGRLP